MGKLWIGRESPVRLPEGYFVLETTEDAPGSRSTLEPPGDTTWSGIMEEGSGGYGSRTCADGAKLGKGIHLEVIASAS